MDGVFEYNGKIWRWSVRQEYGRITNLTIRRGSDWVCKYAGRKWEIKPKDREVKLVRRFLMQMYNH